MAMSYYNENDPFAAAWLRELIAEGLIADGVVDDRSIEAVEASDLEDFTQCHFFAGIGVWSYALRLAGWPDDRPVWTGSCPCQPFSAAGKRTGTADERHLWPFLYHHISQLRPVVFFGEQVAGKGGLAWFDTVSDDLEAASYTVGSADLCAAGFGAPHIRQRLYFVAERMDDAASSRRFRAVEEPENEARDEARLCTSGAGSGYGGMADSNQSGLERRPGSESGSVEQSVGAGRLAGFWRNSDWVYCRDQKYRPVEPGTFPLAHGAANRVGRLRGYGNALVAPVAQAFIESYLEVERVIRL